MLDNSLAIRSITKVDKLLALQTDDLVGIILVIGQAAIRADIQHSVVTILLSEDVITDVVFVLSLQQVGDIQDVITVGKVGYYIIGCALSSALITQVPFEDIVAISTSEDVVAGTANDNIVVRGSFEGITGIGAPDHALGITVQANREPCCFRVAPFVDHLISELLDTAQVTERRIRRVGIGSIRVQDQSSVLAGNLHTFSDLLKFTVLVNFKAGIVAAE